MDSMAILRSSVTSGLTIAHPVWLVGISQDKKDRHFLRFLGDMEYADDESLRQATNTDGKQRKAIVFSPSSFGKSMRITSVIAAPPSVVRPASGRA
jgi:hypothetical protein